LPHRDKLYPDPDEWLNSGDSVFVAPGGSIVAGPLHAGHGILYADCDPAVADASHYTLDPAGHYNRPDIFSLIVRRTRATQVAFDDGPARESMIFTTDASRMTPGGADVPE
jgi:nitrilase